jgi:zinc transport system ATP-binding protein
MTGSAIAIENVWVSVGGQLVLEAISLEVERPSFVALIGPNGGGKTTLLRVMLGLVRSDRGTVRVLGRSAREARSRVGYVPQNPAVDSHFPISVQDVVLMGRLAGGRLVRVFSAADRAAADRAIERVGLSRLRKREIGGLSGGEFRRALIARALAVEPEILLLDEPDAHLDPTAARAVHDLLADLGRRMPVLFVSHDLSVISPRVTGIACLNRVLHYHRPGELTQATLEAIYGCPVELLAHGVPHRVLSEHDGGESSEAPS